MKRMGLVLLILCLAAVTGCAGKESGETSVKISNTAPSTAVSVAKSQGELGAYTVEIKGAAVSKDEKNEPVLVVSFAFQNKSDQAAAFAASIVTKAFQGEDELQSVSMEENAAVFKKVLPGASVEVKKSYRLAEKSAPVEVQARLAFQGENQTPEVLRKRFVLSRQKETAVSVPGKTASP